MCFTIFRLVHTEPVEIAEADLCGYKINETSEVTMGEGDTYLAELLDKVPTVLISRLCPSVVPPV